MVARSYTQEQIEELISCPKIVVDPPRREDVLERGSFRNNARLRSRDSDYEFSMFLRVNEDFRDYFSIGLNYHPRDGPGPIPLLRCNSRHGEHIESLFDVHPHYNYHVHIATAEAIAAGLSPEKHVEVTSEYASYEEALTYFVRRAHILDSQKYFPMARQLKLLP